MLMTDQPMDQTRIILNLTLNKIMSQDCNTEQTFMKLMKEKYVQSAEQSMMIGHFQTLMSISNRNNQIALITGSQDQIGWMFMTSSIIKTAIKESYNF